MKQKRSTLLSINPIFTAHLLNYQDAKYNPRTHLFKEGQKVFLKYDEKTVTLTKEQAEMLNKNDIDYFKTNKDINPIEKTPIYPFVSENAFIPNQQNLEKYLLELGRVLENLRKTLNQKHLILLGDWPTPWLSQENLYAPAKKALEYLNALVPLDFTGGFLLKERPLVQFMPHLFWLTRCNTALPHFMMAFDTSKTVISLCKYGVLHFDFYDKKEQAIIIGVLSKQNFIEVNYCNDSIDFDRLVLENQP